jgi:hypothetical protein
LLTIAPAAFADASSVLSPPSQGTPPAIDESAFPEAETGHHLSYTVPSIPTSLTYAGW